MSYLRRATALASLAALVAACTLSTSGTLSDNDFAGSGAASTSSVTSTGSGPPCAPGTTQACYTGAAGTEGIGACKGGTQTCATDGSFGGCVGEVVPTVEDCATPIDDNCDGTVNEKASNCLCTPGAMSPCYEGPAATMGVGLCEGGMQACQANGKQEGLCMGEVTPTTIEDCVPGLDSNCDGTTPMCTGNPLWSATWGGFNDDLALGVDTNAAGEVWVTGLFYGTMTVGGGKMFTAPGGGDQIFLLKYGPTGDLRFSAAFGDGDYQEGLRAASTPDGGVVIAGRCGGTTSFGGAPLTSAGNWDVCIAQFDKDGNHVWSNIFGDAQNQEAIGVAVDGAGNVFVTGDFAGDIQFGAAATKHTANGAPDMFIVAFDKMGNWKWDGVYGDAQEQDGYGVSVDGTGNPTVVGRFNGTLNFGKGALTSMNNFDAFIVGFDPTGQVRWNKSFGDGSAQAFVTVASDSTGNVVIAGTDTGNTDYGGGVLMGSNNANRDIIVAKYDVNGDYEFANHYGDAADQYTTGVAFDPFGNVLFTGGFDGKITFGGNTLTTTGFYDFYAAKLDPKGTPVWIIQRGDGFGSQTGYRVATDASANVFISGAFQSHINLAMDAQSTGGYDCLVTELAP